MLISDFGLAGEKWVLRSLVLLFTALTAAPAIASELPTMTWAEYHACKYNADQTSDSVAEWISRWNAWMNESGRDDYSAAVLSPFTDLPSDDRHAVGWCHKL